MNKAWLGIDTSNYTTSVSAVIDNGDYVNIKIPLYVKENEKGVRQSEAVFMHTKNLPEAISQLTNEIEKIGKVCISGIGVSSRPRSVDGSYMPCFLSGASLAKSLSSIINVPLYEFSHQEGHIRAALFGSGNNIPERFCSFHLSGGTCELLDVNKTEFGFSEKIIATSADITLGQLVDRVGVMLGIQFPCGHELEKMALQSTKDYKVKITGETEINLSGFENKAKKMLDDGENPCDIAKYVYNVILSAIEKMLMSRADTSLPVLFAGGVSGSKLLQNKVTFICNAMFAEPSLSSDNAVGIALLAKEKYLKVCCNE